MLLLEEKIKMACEKLWKFSRSTVEKVALLAQECEYKKGNTPPDGEWRPLEYLTGRTGIFGQEDITRVVPLVAIKNRYKNI